MVWGTCFTFGYLDPERAVVVTSSRLLDQDLNWMYYGPVINAWGAESMH